MEDVLNRLLQHLDSILPGRWAIWLECFWVIRYNKKRVKDAECSTLINK